MSEPQDSREARIARYKEERKKQLKAQFDSSSKNIILDGSSSSSDGPRTTKASRLRAAATAAQAAAASSTHTKNENLKPSFLSRTLDTPCTSIEKDKSSKRKSNLNRSLMSEEVPKFENGDSKSRRRNRSSFPPNITNSSQSSQEQATSDASSTATNLSSFSPSITASLTNKTLKKSENFSHREEHKIVNGASSEVGKSKSPPKTVISTSSKQKPVNGSTENSYQSKQTSALHFSNKENYKKTDVHIRLRPTNKEIDKNKVPTSQQEAMSAEKRIEKMTSLTRETLARVEKLTKRTQKLLENETNCDKKKSSVQIESIQPSIPVSILKRKVHEDFKSCSSSSTPPVTFSPSVVDRKKLTGKQGILKKRRSLDESQVMRHRSCSPEAAAKLDSKSILKTQRRSSLEDIAKIKEDSLQGILKRRPSRNEEDFDTSLNSPQSILKRRSGASSAGSSSSSHYHVSITTAVVLAAAEGAEIILDDYNEGVRPILKKKSLSEESSTNNSPGDSLKPILKKKSSTDTDDSEDKPKRPILKLSKSHMNSIDNSYSSSSQSAQNQYDTSLDEISRPRLSFCDDENDDLLSTRRNSSKLQLPDFTGSGSRLKSSEEDRNLFRPRVVSVSELVSSFEKSTGAVPKRSSIKRNSDRSKTQPVTFTEFEASLSYGRNCTHGDFSRININSPAASSSVRSLLDLTCSSENDHDLSNYFSQSSPSSSSINCAKMSSDSAFQSLGDGLELEHSDVNDITPVTSPKKEVSTKQHEAQMKLLADEAKYRILSKGNKDRQKYRSTSPTRQRIAGSRFLTQPITLNEVQEAAKFSNADDSDKSVEIKSILKTKPETPILERRGTSKSPPPNFTNSQEEPYLPRITLNSETVDDEGISSNEGSDSEISDCTFAKKTNSPGMRTVETSDDSSSGGREIQSIISREALKKRLQMRERSKNENNIQKSRSQTTVTNESTEELADGIKKSMTMTAMGRIGKLQAKLQHCGDNDWRSRLPRVNNEKLSEKTSIEARKDELGASANLWKNKIIPSDADKFSVEGRMSVIEPATIPINIPTPDKDRRKPKPRRFRGTEVADNKSSSSTSESPELENNFNKSVSLNTSPDESSESDTCLKPGGRKVELLKLDDESFKSFFTKVELNSRETILISTDDLDCIQSDAPLNHIKKNINRKRKMISKNPLKVLASRNDIRTEYFEYSINTSKFNFENNKEVSRHAHLAPEARQGLISKEDFSSVILKKPSAPSSSYLPYKNPMLLHIKGRRYVQTRLVEPVEASINEGDTYILITPDILFTYIGKFSNVIEQNRAVDIVNHIRKSNDMGCKPEKCITIKESTPWSEARKFWEHLQTTSCPKVAKAGHKDEDEIYESNVVSTNMVYEVQNYELVPLEISWAVLPKIEILNPSKVLIFDFGTEMYIWSGKNANSSEKKLGLKLASELWGKGFNYSDCSINPITVSQILGARDPIEQPFKSESRPSWALFSKITQHGETILFREKFADWPDYSKMKKNKTKVESKTLSVSDIKPCDAKLIYNSKSSEPDLVVENTHLGRGRHYFDEDSRRHFEIKTSDVTCWTIFENTYEKISSEFIGHFFDSETYIIRWRFRVNVTGRELSGKPSKHVEVGRDRCIYFCWLGKNASINEKGAAALLTVELDLEHAPQIRVTQGFEPPAFLQLFDGKMFIHLGKSNVPKCGPRLYICRGVVKNETVLVEVPYSIRSLRSRGNFILINDENLTIWNGLKSEIESRTVVKDLANDISQINHPFFNTNCEKVIVFEEGDDEKFLKLIGEQRHLYFSLNKMDFIYKSSPRLFQITSSSGVLKVNEILSPHRSDKCTPFPFLQSDLYSMNQPSLFLLDNEHELWLWQGWWPKVEIDVESSEQTGSGAIRWQAERRAAMQTVVDYINVKFSNKDTIPAYLVWAGLEPLAFSNLFPVWCDRDDIAEINIKEGRKAGEMVPIEKELALLTRTTYPLAELMQHPLPEGVDPTHLENYLSDEDFIKIMALPKETFLNKPVWRQKELKKEKGLF